MVAIAMSLATRQNLAALQAISDQMNMVQKRLATGRRVNVAADDPVAYFTSIALSGRAAALGGLNDGISSAQNALDTANTGIKAIQSLVTSAQSIANQALQSAASFVKIVGANSTALTTSSTISSSGGSTTRFKAGDTVTVSDGTTTATYTAANNDTVQTFLNAVNGTANLKLSASLNASGQIQLQANSNVDVTIGGTLTGSGTLSGIIGLTAGTTTYTVNTARQSLAQQFDLIRTQIDQSVSDASFGGVNLLNGGSLAVNFNESGSSKLNISGTQLNSAGLGIAASTNQFQTDTDINAALSNLTRAITTLQSQTTVLSSNTSVINARKDFTKGLIDTLNAGANDLVASNVDEDSALLLALQTRQQIAVGLLSLTQGSSQSALRLLGG